MIIKVNKENYMQEWLKLIAIFKTIKNDSKDTATDISNLKGRNLEVFELIARYKKVGKDQRYKLANILNMSEASLGNYIKKLKDSGLIRKVKKDNLPYYYECSFPVPNSLEQLLNRQEVITFKLDNQ